MKGQLLKVIDWMTDSQDVVAYRFPMNGQEIMYGSKLTVRESQVAIFMNKGEIADIFGPGMHKLETSNLPFLTKLLSLPTGFKSPFKAEVYFVSTRQFINQKWGTSNPITMRDKDFGAIRIRGFGTYSFRVTKPEAFLKQLLGTNSSFKTSDVCDYLRSMLITSMTDTIAESKVSALDLSSNLREFNKLVTDSVTEDFAEIGLGVTKFLIENISFPEEVEKAIDKRSSLGVMSDQMDNFMKYQTAHAVRDAAQNPSGMGGLGAGLASGLAVADVMRSTVGSMNQPQQQAPAAAPAAAATPKKFCCQCGHEMKATAKFCPDCGAKQTEKPTCPKCGYEPKAGAKFCPECGQAMNK